MSKLADYVETLRDSGNRIILSENKTERSNQLATMRSLFPISPDSKIKGALVVRDPINERLTYSVCKLCNLRHYQPSGTPSRQSCAVFTC